MICSADEENREVFEQVLGHMIKRCIESGMIRKDEMTIMLEDMIQSVERGTLKTALECA